MSVDVGVQLRCQDGFVPEHLLHNPQIGTILNEVRGKRMPERMRRYILVHPRRQSLPLYHIEHGNPAQRVAPEIEKRNVISRTRSGLRPHFQIIAEPLLLLEHLLLS